MNLRRREILSKLIHLLCECLPGLLTEGPGGRVGDLHIVTDLKPRDQERQNTSSQGVDFIHVVNGTEREAGGERFLMCERGETRRSDIRRRRGQRERRRADVPRITRGRGLGAADG